MYVASQRTLEGKDFDLSYGKHCSHKWFDETSLNSQTVVESHRYSTYTTK